jgi:response regulator NasT
LAKAQSDLAARKTIDRAKGVLMKERQIDEGAAYAILRKLAMDSGRSVGTVAADLLAIADALKGKEL